jgi:hypothetical protein
VGAKATHQRHFFITNLLHFVKQPSDHPFSSVIAGRIASLITFIVLSLLWPYFKL